MMHKKNAIGSFIEMLFLPKLENIVQFVFVCNLQH